MAATDQRPALGPVMPRRTRPIIYLASRYSRRAEMQQHRLELAALGVGDVLARWLLEDHDWDGGTEGPSLGRGQQLAVDDLEDIERAHCLVLFTEEPGEYRRAGSLVEFGVALATGKHVVIVGPAPNVFTTLPWVPRYATWADALAHLVQWRDAMESQAIRRRLTQ